MQVQTPKNGTLVLHVTALDPAEKQQVLLKVQLLEINADKVTVTTEDTAGTQTTFEGRFLIGADGGNEQGTGVSLYAGLLSCQSKVSVVMGFTGGR